MCNTKKDRQWELKHNISFYIGILILNIDFNYCYIYANNDNSHFRANRKIYNVYKYYYKNKLLELQVGQFLC